jgi:hypothetical protein
MGLMSRGASFTDESCCAGDLSAGRNYHYVLASHTASLPEQDLLDKGDECYHCTYIFRKAFMDGNENGVSWVVVSEGGVAGLHFFSLQTRIWASHPPS